MNIIELGNELAKLGIPIKNEEDGTYRFVGEVIKDICLALRKIRQNDTPENYEKQKNYILTLLVGEQLKNELM